MKVITKSLLESLNESIGLSFEDMNLIEDTFEKVAIENGYKAKIYNDNNLGHGGYINCNDNYFIKLIIFPYPQSIIIEIIKKYEPFLMTGKEVNIFKKEDFTKVDNNILGWVVNNTNQAIQNIKNNTLDESADSELENGLVVDEAARYMFDNSDKDVNYLPDYEEFRDSIMEVSEDVYNKAKEKVIEAINNLNEHHYEDYDGGYGTVLELNDNHTIWKLTNENKSDEEWASIVNSKLAQFEAETGVELLLLGRMGRHACVEPTYDNCMNFDFLQETQERLEEEAINEFNSEEMNESSYPNFDLPKGYSQDVYDAYFEYCNDVSLDDEPLDFTEWYNKNYGEHNATEDLDSLVRNKIKENGGNYPDEIEYKGKIYKCFNVMSNDLEKGDRSLVYYCNMENTPSGDPQESDDYFFVNSRLQLNPNGNGFKGVREVNYVEDLTEGVEEKENNIYIYSNAESYDESDARSMIDAQYAQEFPKLEFKIHKDDTGMYFVDFIGTYQDICDALINLGWYNEEEINRMTDDGLIKPYIINEEVEENEEQVGLWVNGKIYWEGNKSDVDDNLLMDVADQASEEDGKIYDYDEVDIKPLEESKKGV